MLKETFSKDLTSEWYLLSRNAHATAARNAGVSFCISLFPHRGTSILLYNCRPHAGPRMYATFFVSLWKREKCANKFLVVARRERLRKGGGRIEAGKTRDEGEFSCGSRVKLHLRDPYSLHISCARVCTFTTKAHDYFRWPA